MIATYLYLEHMVSALALEATKGRLLKALTDQSGTYFVIPFLYVLLHLPVIAVFAVLELVIWSLDRLTRPITAEQVGQ